MMCITGNPLRDCKDGKEFHFYIAKQIYPIINTICSQDIQYLGGLDSTICHV